MPKLITADRRLTKKIELPSSTKEDPAWVEVYTEVLAGDLEVVGDNYERRGYASLTGVVNLIKSWNMQDENGEIAEINIANVRRLKGTDFGFLSDEISKIKQPSTVTPEVKKN